MATIRKRVLSSLFAAFSALALSACGGTLSDEASGSLTQEVKQVIPCGGIAGLACPDGLRCVDDPTDDCDPNNGGADCIGECRPGGKGGGKGGGCGKKDPSKTYVAYGDQCQVVRFLCAIGTEYFSDSCGCGCQAVTGGEPCGGNVCGAGTYCCNPSCGICAPTGGFCTQQFCGP